MKTLKTKNKELKEMIKQLKYRIKHMRQREQESLEQITTLQGSNQDWNRVFGEARLKEKDAANKVEVLMWALKSLQDSSKKGVKNV